jgi:hypothetical protein
MAAIDPRAIQSQAFGRYNRVTEYNAAALAGLLTKPYDEDNPNGWGPPITDDDGNPIIPGTPGTQPNRVLFLRGNEAQPAPGAIVRAQTFRAFESPNVLDWRGKVIGGVAGQYPVLHFHGPPARYFSTSSIVNIGFQSFDLEDNTAGEYESFFYDSNGTVKVSGPPLANGDIKGVAIRNQLTDSEEYVVITGLAKNPPDGLQFWVRSRADADDPWTLIGTHDFSDVLGTGQGFAGFTWNVPVHFNQLGTKAVTVTMGANNGDTDKRNRLFRIEFEILSGSVTTSGLVDVTQGSTSILTERNNSGSSSSTSPADPSNLPACPDTGTFTQETTTTFDEEVTSITNFAPTSIAFDYKIDTDDELGSIEVTIESQGSLILSGGGTISTNSQACWNGTFPVITPGSTNGGGTINRIMTSDRFIRLTFTIDGGRHSGSIGPLQDFIDQAGVHTTTSVTTVVADVSSTTTTVEQVLSNADEFIRNFQFFWVFKFEVQSADIRYGSMVIGNRKMFMDRFRFNTVANVGIPGNFGEPPVFIGEIKNSTGVNGLVSFLTPASFAAWSETFEFRRDTWIESADFAIKIRDDDGPYAIRVGDPNNVMLLNTLPSVISPVPPPGTTITNSSNPDAIPNILSQSTQVPVMAQRGRGPFGGHDRFGEFFFQHEHGNPSFDFAIMRMFGTPFVQFQDIDERTSQADYEFTDPVAAVGIPGDEPGFEPIVLV